MTETTFDEKTLRYLKTLSRSYPTTQTVMTEIINLRAILNLPKGTEHYISDIHGEYQGLRHILRNALIPIITVAGTQLSIIVGGSIVIESIFSIPGMGALLVTAVNSRDYPEILGVTFIISIFVCFINLLVDITYCAVDPRIRDEFSSGTKTKKKEREDEKHTKMPAEGGV